MRAATAARGGFGSIKTTIESLPLPSQASAALTLTYSNPNPSPTPPPDPTPTPTPDPNPNQTSAAADLVTKATRNFFAAIIILVPFSYTAAAPVAFARV